MQVVAAPAATVDVVLVLVEKAQKAVAAALGYKTSEEAARVADDEKEGEE